MLDGYRAFIMLPTTPDDLSIDLVRTKLGQVFDRIDSLAQVEITLPDLLTISIARGDSSTSADWQMRVTTNCTPSVLVEARAIASTYLEPDDPRQLTLATYPYRIEIGCDPDPTMERFNYYVYVLEALETLPGAIVFDPTTTGFIE
jgi:hypothetical protein